MTYTNYNVEEVEEPTFWEMVIVSAFFLNFLSFIVSVLAVIWTGNEIAVKIAVTNIILMIPIALTISIMKESQE